VTKDCVMDYLQVMEESVLAMAPVIHSIIVAVIPDMVILIVLYILVLELIQIHLVPYVLGMERARRLTIARAPAAFQVWIARM